MTKAKKSTDVDMHQVPSRFHLTDWKIMKKLLVDDCLTFQAFVMACFEMYRSRNREFMKLLRIYKDYNDVPQGLRESKTFSPSERNELLKELELDRETQDTEKES